MAQRKWRKVLYEENQLHLPDNYVDEATFLQSLQLNVNVREYKFSHVVRESASGIGQQLARLVIFIVIFVMLLTRKLQPVHLIVATFGAISLSYIVYRMLLRRVDGRTAAFNPLHDLFSCILISTVSFVLTPVIQTLTATISWDTIYCMAFFMFFGHILFHNYCAAYSSSKIVSDEAVSFNVAIFGATCLSSRLDTPVHCFALIVFAVTIFALWPQFGVAIKRWSPSADIFHSLIVLTCSLLGLILVPTSGHLIICLYVGLLLFLHIGCPAILVAMQPLKNTIHGPWDEKMPQWKVGEPMQASGK